MSTCFIANPTELTKSLQRELDRVGCHPGSIDGICEPRGRQAMELFNQHSGLALDKITPTCALAVTPSTDGLHALVAAAAEAFPADVRGIGLRLKNVLHDAAKLPSMALTEKPARRRRDTSKG